MSAPVLFKKPTPSQINLIKMHKKSFLIIEKIKKYRKCPPLYKYKYNINARDTSAHL